VGHLVDDKSQLLFRLVMVVQVWRREADNVLVRSVLDPGYK